MVDVIQLVRMIGVYIVAIALIITALVLSLYELSETTIATCIAGAIGLIGGHAVSTKQKVEP